MCEGVGGGMPSLRTGETFVKLAMPVMPDGQQVVCLDDEGSGISSVVEEGVDDEEAFVEEEEEVEKASKGGTWRTCGVGGCVYRTKESSHLKRHKAAIHSIDIVWHDCPERGCEYMAKEKGKIKKHRTLVYDIGVTWHECPEPDCSDKAVQGKAEEKDRGAQSRHARHRRNLACLH